MFKFSMKKIFVILVYLFFIFPANSEAPSTFIKNLTKTASEILSENITIDEKTSKLQKLATKNVDIKGIGFYTLGKHRKTLNEDEKKQYSELFQSYFLKSFASRLVEYTDPRIIVKSEEKINDKYTIVNSVLVATKDRPEIKIDWRVYTKNQEEPLVRDLIIEGLSLARTQKEEFNSVISSNNNDVNYLFLTLKNFIND